MLYYFIVFKSGHGIFHVQMTSNFQEHDDMWRMLRKINGVKKFEVFL